jgi:hypothetical protein
MANAMAPDAEMGDGAVFIAELVAELRGKLPHLAPPPALEPEQPRFRTSRSAHPYYMDECVCDQPRALRQVLRSQKETGARVVALLQEGDRDIAALVDHPIFLPQVPEFLTPVVYLAPLHLFTYWLALEMGRTPDTFRRHEPRHATALRDMAF